MTLLTLLLPISIGTAGEITDPILGEIRYAGYAAFKQPDRITHDTGIFVYHQPLDFIRAGFPEKGFLQESKRAL